MTCYQSVRHSAAQLHACHLIGISRTADICGFMRHTDFWCQTDLSHMAPLAAACCEQTMVQPSIDFMRSCQMPWHSQVEQLTEDDRACCHRNDMNSNKPACAGHRTAVDKMMYSLCIPSSLELAAAEPHAEIFKHDRSERNGGVAPCI